MPILKQLVTNPNAAKRRSRADLTAEMISAPMGDFRHTMHIGRSGDAFGDTSFLKSKGEEQPEPEESVSNPPPFYDPVLHAESIMSFHIDLGPSMLGDILSVMDKGDWERDLDQSLDDVDGNRTRCCLVVRTFPAPSLYVSASSCKSPLKSVTLKYTKLLLLDYFRVVRPLVEAGGLVGRLRRSGR
uniref:CDC42 effector protein 4 n=1 Tax=Leptobrachium leishanense TaxID=445787 RepID=A0A8C5WLJ3_9ANUR